MGFSAGQYAQRSLWYYRRPNLALAAAVAAATAVLVGALVVGSSMRGSLRQLTFDRLADIDEMMIADHFFTEGLVEQLRAAPQFAEHYRVAAPVILFPNGTVEFQSRAAESPSLRRANNVTVLGVTQEIWRLQSQVDASRGQDWVANDRVAINRALADDLGVDAAAVQSGTARITLRVPKPTLLPNDSALGEKEDLVSSLVDLPVATILENRELGRFAVEPSQQVPRNLFIDLETLQDALASGSAAFERDPRRVNAVFLAGQDASRPPSSAVSELLLKQLQPAPEDLGLTVKTVKLQMGEDANARVFGEYLNLTTERLVFSDRQSRALRRAFPEADPVQTYLVNDLHPVSGGGDHGESTSGIPYSMVASIDPGNTFLPVSAISGEPIQRFADDEIVLNEWAAEDLGVKPGDVLELVYFLPESTQGEQSEDRIQLKLADIAKLTEPSQPFTTRRRQLLPALFDEPPTWANDPDFTPEVPGLSDSDSIDNWDLPFKMTNRIRPQDDQYWSDYRTTPKGFVSLATGQKLWGSRFGNLTGWRLPADTYTEQGCREKLVELWRESSGLFGVEIVGLKRAGLQAAGGTTPFDALFLGLSLFIIAAALMLVGILFRLGVEQRVEQLGLLAAVGFNESRLRRVWLGEILIVCVVGASAGMGLGIGYGFLMILALRTWWVGAIATPFLNLHLELLPILAGFLSGVIVSLATIHWSIRSLTRQPARQLLSGRMRDEATGPTGRRSTRWISWAIIGAVVLAVTLSIVATRLGGETQAVTFMGGGFLVLLALILAVYRQLSGRQVAHRLAATLTLKGLAYENAKRNPLRSTLVVGLVGVASFLIVAISSFRLQPTERSTGGAQWIAESSLPIIPDLGSDTARDTVLPGLKSNGSELSFFSLRLKPGQDASCNNLYQSTQPQVMGIPRSWIERFDSKEQLNMLWAGTVPGNDLEKANPWHLLERPVTQDDSIPVVPVVIDKNTAMYSLKVYSVGSRLTVDYDSGESVIFEVVGFLENSLFQGSLLVSEANFNRVFPTISGYRRFLIASDSETRDADEVMAIESQLGDYGFDIQTSREVLAQFAKVQNTYLSAFQSLGGLGLLLGTFGLAAVQLRSIVERRKELALMQAVGFQRTRLLWLLFGEQVVLLLGGLGVGVLAAFATTIPHWLTGEASPPWLQLSWILSLVLGAGLLAALWSARSVMRLPLAATLRG